MTKRQKLKSYYEREAKYYGNHQEELYLNANPYRRYPHKRRKILVDSFLENATNLLDAGCSEGLYAKGKDVPYVGIDIARRYVVKAKSKHSHGHFVVADVCDLPFVDHAFEYVLCSEVLEHVLDWKNAICELARVSENVVVTVPLLTIWMLPNRLRKRQKESIFDRPGRGHINCFTYRGLLEQLRATGLTIRKTRGVSWFPVWEMAEFRFPHFVLKLIRFLDEMLSNLGLLNFMAATIIIVAGKKKRGTNDGSSLRLSACVATPRIGKLLSQN